jgi:hypothetical protein
LHLSHHPVCLRSILTQLHEGGLPQQFAAEKQTVADLMAVQLLGQLDAAEGVARFHSNIEAELGAVGAASRAIPREAVPAAKL